MKLTKAELAERERHADALKSKAQALEEALQEFNSGLDALRAAFQPALDEYNEALDGAREFKEDIVSSLQEKFDDKSDRWKESERGQQVQQWIEEWEGAEFEPLELDLPDALEELELGHGEALLELADEGS